MNSDNESNSLNSELREIAEKQLAQGFSLLEPTECSCSELLHELCVHQIELEMQNETLRKTQVELEKSRDLYVDLYEFAPVGYVTLNEEGVITKINLTTVTLLGKERTKLIDRSFSMLIESADRDRWARHFVMVKKHAKQMSVIELEMPSMDGSVIQVRLHCVSDTASVRITLIDITENKKAETEIHHLAFYDSLTQLPNRRLLQDRLSQVIDATARSGQYGALFFIDIDHFKILNDTHGHDIGDLLLIGVAKRLHESVRKKDFVARQGGDEFIVLLEELGTTGDEAIISATHLGDKLHNTLTTPFNLDGLEYHCNISIGVSLFQGSCSIEELFKHADIALYDAKNTGRNKVCFFAPAMQELLEQRSALETALHHAIPNHELELYYQIQMNSSRRIVGVEALLRWKHPQLGLVLPDDFIPLAEDTGLILPIGRWVLETACAQIKQWESNPLTSGLQIAVNVSARQFYQRDFVEQLQNVLVASGANPTRLKLELTESMMLEDPLVVIAKMQEIKQLNVLFSMDDFGTGYSSLSYLTQLPLNQLKIDKAFVANLNNSKNDETIIRAIIAMGLGLNMNVIAEGVETEAQYKFLEALGCNEYQGYLFSRPLPIEELEKYL